MTTDIRRATQVTGREFPYADDTVTFLQLGGPGQAKVAQSVTDKLALCRSITPETPVLAVWPGKTRSDVFLVDDPAVALRVLRDREPVPPIVRTIRLYVESGMVSEETKAMIRELVQPAPIEVGDEVRIVGPASFGDYSHHLGVGPFHVDAVDEGDPDAAYCVSSSTTHGGYWYPASSVVRA